MGWVTKGVKTFDVIYERPLVSASLTHSMSKKLTGRYWKSKSRVVIYLIIGNNAQFNMRKYPVLRFQDSYNEIINMKWLFSM